MTYQIKSLANLDDLSSVPVTHTVEGVVVTHTVEGVIVTRLPRSCSPIHTYTYTC